MYRKYLTCVKVVLSINILIGLALSKPQLKDDIYPFQNTSLSWDERVDDLVSRLTVEEIASQLETRYSGQAQGIPRFNILPYSFLNECLRGIVKYNCYSNLIITMMKINLPYRETKIQLRILNRLD